MTATATANLTQKLPQQGSESSEFRVDYQNAIIYGCAISGPKSKNNREFLDSALGDIVRLSNNCPVSVVPHGSETALDMLGQVRDPRRRADGVPIADWHLAKKDPRTERILESADRFPGNFGLSIDCPWSAIEKRRRDDGIIEVKRVRQLDWLSLVHDMGTTRSLRESKESKRRKRKMATRRKAPADPGKRLIESYSDLPPEVTRFIESTCAAAEVDSVVLDSIKAEVEDLKSKLAERDSDVEKLSAELKTFKDAAEVSARRESIRARFEDLTKDLDASVTESVKLTDADLDNLVKMDPADAAIDLAKRVSEAAKSLQESYLSGKRFSESRVPDKDQDEDFTYDKDDREFDAFCKSMVG